MTEENITEDALAPRYMLQFRLPGRPWLDGVTWMNERYLPCTIAELLENYQRNDDVEWRAVIARPEVITFTAGSPAQPATEEPLSQPEPAATAGNGCQSVFAENGEHDWDSYLGKCANPGCHDPG